MEEPEEPSLLDRIEGLPEEMQNELLNNLEYNEVLRLRRVCNRFRHLAEAHLTRRLPNRYLKISFLPDVDHSLSEFKSVRFSEEFIIPKIHFFHKENEYEDDVYQEWKALLQNPDLDWFMENYAPYVKHLHLESLQLPICNAKLLKFLESFTNLEVFQCDNLLLPSLDLWDCYVNSEEPLTFPVFVPNSFKSLKRLLIASVTCSEDDLSSTTKELNRFWIFVSELMKTTVLQELLEPVVQNNVLELDNLETRLKTIVNVIESWKKLDKPLKQFNLRSLCGVVNDSDNREFLEIDQFLPFFQLSAESNIVFDGVEDTYFHSSMGDQFAKYVKSMVSGYPEDLQLYNYENLEAVEFRISELRYFKNRVGTLKCPKLRGLSLQFQRQGCQEDHMYYERLIANRLFHGTKLEKLTSLVLEFDVEIPYLVIPSDLGSSCSNLTYLSLNNYAAESSYFLQLWEGLPHLEHITLSGCANLDDSGFLGDNPQEPAILQLKNLKYLELTNLNRMPRVTDKTLQDAIRHIKLRCFRLMSMSYGCTLENDEYDQLLSPHVKRFQSVGYSSQKISSNNISLDGIRSLRTGVFAETIEQFDLFGLKIDNVPDEALTAVKKEFRSWHF